MTLRSLLLPALVATAIGADAQVLNKVHYLPVVVQVTMNEGKADQFSVALFKDNARVVELPPCDRSAFQFDLDLNAYFTIRITKAGYQEKIIAVDTHVSAVQEEYGPYECVVDLDPRDKYAHSDPFYLDFPSAVIRWDAAKNSFDHSDDYLADIQLKRALLSAQAVGSEQ